MGQRVRNNSNDRNRFCRKRKEELNGAGITDGQRHGRSQFSHHGIADENGKRTYYHVHLTDGVTDRTFPRCSLVCAGPQHLSCRDGICSKSPNFNFFSKGFPYFPDNCGPDAGALTIDYRYTYQEYTSSKDLILFQDDTVLNQVHLFYMRFKPALLPEDILDIETVLFRPQNIDTRHKKLLFITCREIRIGFTHLIFLLRRTFWRHGQEFRTAEGCTKTILKAYGCKPTLQDIQP